MKTKIINILLLITMFVGSLFLSKLFFNIIISILAILSLRELIFIRTKSRRYNIELEILSYVIVTFFVMNNYGNNLDYYLVDYKLLAALILIDLIPLVLINNKKKYSLLDALYLIGSTLLVGITFNLLSQLRTYNVNYVTYIIFIALISSIFEFITNYYIGKTMIFPTINPKKYLEGVFGGLIMGTIIPTMFFISTMTSKLPVYGITIITFILCLFGQFGDLVFTFIKKEFNKSFFSSYKHETSGILDIIDSIVFITLGFILFVSIL